MRRLMYDLIIYCIREAMTVSRHELMELILLVVDIGIIR